MNIMSDLNRFSILAYLQHVLRFVIKHIYWKLNLYDMVDDGERHFVTANGKFLVGMAGEQSSFIVLL